MVKRHTKADPDFKEVVLQAIIEILDLYNSLRKAGGKDFVQRSKMLMKGFQRWVPRCRKSWPEEYQEYSEFMEAFRECIDAGIYQFFTIKRGIIDTKNFQYKFGKSFVHIDNDDDASISFYIQELDLKDDIESLHRFYNVLTLTGGKLVDSDNEFVENLKYKGVVSFLDFLRLTFIYYQFVFINFQHIRTCKFSECKNFFYSKRLGEKRWQYCSDKCRYLDMPKDIAAMRSCQKKMRSFYSNALDRYSDANPVDDISNITLSFKDGPCADCKYKSNPKESMKGDCHQALSNPELVRIVNTLNKKTSTDSKKSVK